VLPLLLGVTGWLRWRHKRRAAGQRERLRAVRG